MYSKLSARILIALSIVFGATIAVLAALDLDRALDLTAIIGGIALGALWTLQAVFIRGRNDSR